MIDFQNVSKQFGAQTVLDRASFRINAGEHAGVVGPNGSGKSTVAAMMAGQMTPDSGAVVVPNHVSVGYLQQQLSEAHSRTPLLLFAEGGVPGLARTEQGIHDIEEQLRCAGPDERNGLLQRLGDLQTQFEHAGGYDLRHRTEAALCGLGFTDPDLGRAMEAFSGGWQMRAALARCLVAHPDILLLDEPSNYLDLPAVEWLQRHLRNFKGVLVLISHDRYLLNTLTTVTIEVANGATERYAGNYDHYTRERATRLETRLAAQKNQERKIEKAGRFVERFRYKATKAAQVKSRIKMIERMETVEVPKKIASRGAIRIPPPSRCGQEVVRLDDVGVTYDGERWVLRHVDLRIERGEKLALVGHNGLGKTTLLRLLAGILPPSSGKRVLGHKVVQGYQSQEFADTMDPNRTVFDTLKSMAPETREQAVRRLLGGFGFSGDAVEKKVSVLSGGEKVRLAFARLLMDPPNFLLLDEPTTHLDIQARETLEEALRQYEGTLCVVSHDTTFVENITHGIVAMQPPGILRFHGAYSDYRERMAAGAGATVAATVPSAQAGPAGAGDKKARRRQRAAERQAASTQVRDLKRAIRRAEKQIDIFEAEREKILHGMADPAPGKDFAETNRRLQLVQREIEAYTCRWETAAEQLEALTAPGDGGASSRMGASAL